MSNLLRSKLIAVSSSRKTNDSKSNSDFRVNLQASTSIQDAKSIAIKSITFPNVNPNVNQFNNELTFTSSVTGTFTVEIPVGQYTIETLIPVIESEVSAVSGNSLTITQDSLTNFLTYSVDVGTMVWFPTSLGSHVGFADVDETGTAPAQIYEATALNDLYGDKIIAIRSTTLGDMANFIDSVGNHFPVVDLVQVNVPYGTQIFKDVDNFELHEIDYLTEKNIQNIDIQLINEKGDIIDLQGLDFTMIIKVFY